MGEGGGGGGGGGVSKLYIGTLNCYKAKFYQSSTVRSKCQATAHRL